MNTRKTRKRTETPGERFLANMDKAIDFHHTNANDPHNVGSAVVVALLETRNAYAEAHRFSPSMSDPAEQLPPPSPLPFPFHDVGAALHILLDTFPEAHLEKSKHCFTVTIHNREYYRGTAHSIARAIYLALSAALPTAFPPPPTRKP